MSWVTYLPDHPFPIQNLPYGCAVLPGQEAARPVTIIGDNIVDLSQLSSFFESDVAAAFQSNTLNAFMSLGNAKWKTTRATLVRLFGADEAALRDNADLKKKALFSPSDVKMVLPAEVGDYTDFYASKEHATNLGKMFRPGQPPILENWFHIPVGYHGRASSIVVSGTDVVRPNGQQRPVPEAPPVFGASKAVDFELEMAAWVGVGNALGTPITLDEAKQNIFGFSLFNDWTARDIQKWEYVPLGPFLGKNFASTTSPWIITTEALEPFLVAGPEQTEVKPLPYLQSKAPGNYDINLSVAIQPEGAEATIVTQANSKLVYWSAFQQLVHHSINGCNMRPGDVIASGTISGTSEGTLGSMIELSWAGSKTVPLSNGQERKMIQDNDTIILAGECVGNGFRIGFGECIGKVLPAKKLEFN